MHLNREASDDPAINNLLKEIENMVTRGRLNMPLTLTFAVVRDDVTLLQQLLKRGDLDVDECDNDYHTPLHIAASKGNEECVRELLKHGADPNCRDADGKVPLGEAIMGSHESVAQLLSRYKAILSAEDSGLYACIAVEKNNKALLENLIKYGGDVTAKNKDGETALHKAVCDGNLELVEFLLDNGCDMDIPDRDGFTPRDLADQQSHGDIVAIFEARKKQSTTGGSTKITPGLTRYQSEPVIRHVLKEDDSVTLRRIKDDSGTKRANFNNSIFGKLSLARPESKRAELNSALDNQRVGHYGARVTISCPQKGKGACKLVLLPESIDELLKLGETSFGFALTRVLTKDGAEINDVAVIRDGDHLVLAGSEE